MFIFTCTYLRLTLRTRLHRREQSLLLLDLLLEAFLHRWALLPEKLNLQAQLSRGLLHSLHHASFIQTSFLLCQKKKKTKVKLNICI